MLTGEILFVSNKVEAEAHRYTPPSILPFEGRWQAGAEGGGLTEGGQRMSFILRR